MKKILIIIAIFCMLPALADTAPYYIKSVPQEAIGVYQTDKSITLYQEPNTESEIIKTVDFSYNSTTMPESSFAILINDKQLGFLYVTDIDEDGWVQVLYDRKKNLTGWTQTIDRMQFQPWLNFYNLYGRKYGIRVLKDAPEDTYTLYSKCEDLSQPVSKVNHVQKIKLTKISGNWALVSVMDLDKTPKTGWMKWRGDDGKIYVFPNIN